MNKKYRWETEKEYTQKAILMLRANYCCTNCGHTIQQDRDVYMDEIPWVVDGVIEGEDCPKCEDTMRIELPEKPILLLTEFEERDE